MFVANAFAPTSVDPSFGEDGIIITDIFGGTDVLNNLVVDRDNRILGAGSATKHVTSDHFALVRYTSSGSLDKSFGINGVVTTGKFADDTVLVDGIMGLSLLQDNTIIVAGRGRKNGSLGFALLAYTDNGLIDRSFGDGGLVFVPDAKASNYPLALTVDRANRIVVAAASHYQPDNSSFAIYRFLANGEVDKNFASGGKVETTITYGMNVPRALAIDDNDNIVVGGFTGRNKFVVVRYRAEGRLDTSFGQQGFATIEFNAGGIDTLHALTLGKDGRIVVGGDVQVGSIGGIRTVDFGLARLLPDGSLDVSFNKTGKQITHFIHPAASSLWALATDDDGKTIAVGDASSVKGLALARYNLDGSLDDSFGDGGKEILRFGKTCHWEAVGLERDGKIIAGGYVWNGKHYDMALSRFIPGLATKDKKNY